VGKNKKGKKSDSIISEHYTTVGGADFLPSNYGCSAKVLCNG